MTLPFSEQELVNLRENEPEKYFQFITELAQRIPPDVVKESLFEELAKVARSGETLEAFEAFYQGVHDSRMLPHNLDAEKDAFQAHAEGEIWQLLGFRGSRKTTTSQITKNAWLHGLYPDKTGVITGANDPNAKLIAKSIAQIIEHHPFFKKCFPHVVVDKERGWGAEGYWIRDNRVSREKWVEKQAKINDPTFVGGGYGSSEINGKHPTLYLSVDDLHDIGSSSSQTEREAIKNVFQFQILPTVLREKDKLVTRINITGVPFAKDDTYAELKQTGGVRYTHMPIMKRALEGDGVYIDGVNPKTGAVMEDIVGWWHLTAPELFGVKSIIDLRSKGKNVFWQMYMVDIESAKTGGLTYYTYDHNLIGFNLPTFGGADPSGIDPDVEVGGSKRSSFSLCYLCKLPQGGAVIKDGVLKPLGMEKAKLAILQAQSMFPNWETTGIEDVSYGKMFMQHLRLDSRVRFIKSNLKDIETNRVNNKGLRFLNEVHPYIESGLIRISDESTPFLDALRYLMDNFWELDHKKPHESFDAADALYHAVKLIPEILRLPVNNDISPVSMNSRGGLWHPLMGARHG